MHIARRLSCLLVGTACLLLRTPAFSQTTVAGYTPGNVDIAESGAATYGIPIQVPPGVAGVEPKLALVYNSQAGNGFVGIGWSLEGLPAVQRCGRTIVQDGIRTAVSYDATDRYCLNGQRLVLSSGTYGGDGAVYATERESFSRWFSYGAAGGGPTSFTGNQKVGLALDFGGTGQSRITAVGKPAVRIYAVNRMLDNKALFNYLVVSYHNSTDGENRPTQVDYTYHTAAGLSAFAKVVFVSETRPDVIIRNVAGSDIRIPRRLKNIQTYVGTTMVKDYRLAYESSAATGRSRLASVTECSGDGTQCLPPLRFTYSNYGAAGSMTANGGHLVGAAGWRLADLFGEGRQLYYTHDGNGTHHATRINPDATVQNWTWTGGLHAGPAGWETADLFGDGKELYWTHHGNGQHYATRLNSNGTVQNWSWTGGHGAGSQGWRVADLFGDGRKVYYTHHGDGQHFATRFNADGTVQNWTWTGGHGVGNAGWNVGDLFGDGRQIYYTHSADGTHYATRLNEDGSLQNWTWPGGHGVGAPGWRLADLFGDGRDIYYTHEGNGTHKASRLNSDGTVQNFTWTGGAALGDVGWDTADLNGEGREVYTTHWANGTHSATRLNPDGTLQSWTWTDAVGLSDAGWRMGDLFGSGRTVYYTHSTGGTHYASAPVPLANSTVPADLLTEITLGLGARLTFTYRPLTDATVYSKDSNAAFPSMDLQAPLYVVRTLAQLDSAGASMQTEYSYEGAKTHLTGGGFLGFRKVNVVNTGTGIKVSTTIRQDYPFHGLPISVVTTQPGGGVLSQLVNTWTDSSYPNAYGKHHRSDVTQSVQSSNDLDGSVMPTVTTTTSYDAYGNPTSVQVSTGDGYSKTTTNTYTNTTVPSSKWLLGRLIRSVVTSTAP